jgi:hypothetical protein
VIEKMTDGNKNKYFFEKAILLFVRNRTNNIIPAAQYKIIQGERHTKK